MTASSAYSFVWFWAIGMMMMMQDQYLVGLIVIGIGFGITGGLSIYDWYWDRHRYFDPDERLKAQIAWLKKPLSGKVPREVNWDDFMEYCDEMTLREYEQMLTIREEKPEDAARSAIPGACDCGEHVPPYSRSATLSRHILEASPSQIVPPIVDPFETETIRIH